MVADKLAHVRRAIAESCRKVGRDPGGVKLVCVTKGSGLDAVAAAIGAGAMDLGENRVSELVTKSRTAGPGVVWHLIGRLQTNKVKDAVRIASLIHSVDSIRLAKEIEARARVLGKIQDILIQVNVSGEMSKSGIAPGAAAEFINELSACKNIKIRGLMTMAPETDDPEAARPHFRKLRELRDELLDVRSTKYDLRVLSMGMSNDFRVAIEEGSTMVRLGRAIFS